MPSDRQAQKVIVSDLDETVAPTYSEVVVERDGVLATRSDRIRNDTVSFISADAGG